MAPPPQLKQVGEVMWELPQSFQQGMRVPGILFGTKNIIQEMDNAVFTQLANVCTLPGIVKNGFCMPDGHSGYGFPIGGVAAFDPKEGGVISPGGIGFDINCGMRLLTTNLTYKDVQHKLKEIVDELFRMVPAAVGAKGFVKLSTSQLNEIMTDGAKWCIENGYGWKKDIEAIEDYGTINGADPSAVGDRARQRGILQLGTLGSGNHYLEIQVVKKHNVFDQELARTMGINQDDQIVVMVHCGSRGFGHQIATDYLKLFLDVMKRENITVADRELSCAPFESKEGQDYFKAMACAANFAFANRQVILHQIRKAFESIFHKDAESLGMNMVYDVAHNIAKLEKHKVDGKTRELLVHRKGSTRAFGPGRDELGPMYKKIGQPVIVGGSMETGSYLLVGTDKAEKLTFSSTMHGAGRSMSRTQARQDFRGEKLQQDMLKKGIYVHAVSMPGLAEEAGSAYKDINEVVKTMEIAGVTKPVVALKPIGNVKG